MREAAGISPAWGVGNSGRLGNGRKSLIEISNSGLILPPLALWEECSLWKFRADLLPDLGRGRKKTLLVETGSQDFYFLFKKALP